MKYKNKSFKRSLFYAFCGLADAWRSERNLRFDTAAALLALVCGIWLRLRGLEWLFLFSAIFLVLTMEMMNTALERVVDLFTSEYHPLARLAKNAAAGAALLASVYAVVTGCFLFLPKILARFNVF